MNAKYMNYVLDPTKLELTLKKNKIHTWHFKEDTLHFGSNILHVNADTEQLCFTGDQLIPFKRERLLKGSGQLELRVIRDGPRRVLQILDVVQSNLAGTSVDTGLNFVKSADRKHYLASTFKSTYTTRISVNIEMPEGIGISAIGILVFDGNFSFNFPTVSKTMIKRL